MPYSTGHYLSELKVILGGWQQSGGSGDRKQLTHLLSTLGAPPGSDVGIPGDQGIFQGKTVQGW